MKKEYYGDKKIKEIVKLDSKTCFGKERVKLLFSKNESIELPLEVAEQFVSKESKDATALVAARTEPIIKQILALLTEAELTRFEIEHHTLPNVAGSATRSMQAADKILWKKDFDDRTLRDVDKILRPKKYKN